MSVKERVVMGVVRRGVKPYFAISSRIRRALGDYPDDPARPWMDEYAAFGIPETIEPIPDVPLHQFLYDAADANPNDGFMQRGVTVTFPEVLADAERLATALAERGIETGDRVATILPTSVQFAVVDAAISIAGGVHVPNDFLDATEDLEYRLQKGDAEVLVGHDEHEELVFELAESVGIDDVILTTVADYSADPPTHEPRDDADWLPHAVEDAERDPPDVPIDPAEDVRTLLFTGGTTGKPKGVQLTHRNVVANVLQSNAVQDSFSMIDFTTLLAQPVYHSYGYTGLHRQIEGGISTALVDDARDVAEMARLIEAHDIRMVSGVPTQFMELLREEVEKSLIAISGSAPLADEVRDDFEAENLGITQGYGLSEMAPATHVDIRGLIESLGDWETTDVGFDQPSIGFPLPDTRIKLVDVETGEEIPVPEAVAEEREGELYLDGPQRMKGYLDRADPFDEEGYIPTGDVVKVDPKGRFYVVDRVKDMINVSGLKVYSAEVDEELYALEGVRRPATVGVPDPDRPGSELVEIYVEPEPGADLTAADVRAHLEGRVPRQAMPEHVAVVDEIPLTDVGKIDKQTLRERREAGDGGESGDEADEAANATA